MGDVFGEEAFGSQDMPLYFDGTQEPGLRDTNGLLPLTEAKKRGRKPSRPFDPIKKKTEEKDKYWLRAFRAYMKTHFSKIRKQLTAEERFFWRDYLSAEGRPEKGNRFLSYGRQYKTALFSNPSFVQQFQEWFLLYGESELLKKCPQHTPLWFVFFDYASKDLFNYTPNSASPLQQDSGAESPETRASPEPCDFHIKADYELAKAEYDITMIEDTAGDVDTLLEEM